MDCLDVCAVLPSKEGARRSDMGTLCHKGENSEVIGGMSGRLGRSCTMTSRRILTVPPWLLGLGIHTRYPFASFAYPRNRPDSPQGENLDSVVDKIRAVQGTPNRQRWARLGL